MGGEKAARSFLEALAISGLKGEKVSKSKAYQEGCGRKWGGGSTPRVTERVSERREGAFKGIIRARRRPREGGGGMKRIRARGKK